MSKKPKEKDIYERDKQGRVIGEKPEYRNKPGHHLGRDGEHGSPGNGYELLPDGSYQLAPSDQKRIRRINSEIRAVQDLLSSVWDHAEQRSRDLAVQKEQWFVEICRMIYREEDLSRASFSPITGRLTFMAAEKPPTKSGE